MHFPLAYFINDIKQKSLKDKGNLKLNQLFFSYTIHPIMQHSNSFNISIQ